MVAGAIQQLRMARGSLSHRMIPLLAVPYMGEVAQELCARDAHPIPGGGSSRILVSTAGEVGKQC